MNNKETIEEHNSYGLIGLSRISAGERGINLFGSSIRHSSIMTLRIRRAVKRRSLARYWFGSKEELIEVYLSPSQFADLITTPNVGDGVPCTIRYINRQPMGECPEESQRQIFQRELEDDVSEAMTEANTLVAEVKEMQRQKKTVTNDFVDKIEMLAQHINANMPFLHQQFVRAMDRTTTEAKAEVEEFVNAKVYSLGIEGLTDMVKQLSDPVSSAAFQLGTGESGDETGD
jgi:hypothetical protein